MTHINYSELSQPELIARLRKYNNSNGLYKRDYYHGAEFEESFGLTEWNKHILPLRNAIPRVVSFFGMKTLPQNIEIITKNETLKQYIEQILTWSNFNAKKQLMIEDWALTGDLFLKVNLAVDKVFFTWIDPYDVTVIEEDSRGNLLNIRIDFVE